MDTDLAPDKTEGFKVGEKKTLDEYQKLGMLLERPQAPEHPTSIHTALSLNMVASSGIYTTTNTRLSQTKSTRL